MILSNMFRSSNFLKVTRAAGMLAVFTATWLLIAAIVFVISITNASAQISQSSFGQRTEPLPPEQVFFVSGEIIREAESESGENIARVIFQMPSGFYLYREQIVVSMQSDDVQLNEVQLPPAQSYDDPFFGVTDIYREGVTISARTTGQGHFTLRIVSQGCDKQLGICYPPQIHDAKMHSDGGEANIIHMSALDLDENVNSATDSNQVNDSDSQIVDDDAALATKILIDNDLWQIIIAFLGFGLLLSFTPCVLPMIPILLGIISGNESQNEKPKKGAAILTLFYIAGVCVTYTALGVAAGLSGQLIVPYLQSPPALIITACIFVVLALSMFGLYEIQIPAKLRKLGGGGQGGNVGGAFVMGAVSAAVVSPCVAAPLIGVLVYIGTSGDAVLGGTALFSLSLGMSGLLAATGIFGLALPRTGAWMDNIRKLSGVLLLAVAVWVSSVLLPAMLVVGLYGALCILAALLLNHTLMPVAMRAVAVTLFIWGSIMLIGAAAGSRDPLSPLSVFRASHSTTDTHLTFVPVKTINQTEQLVRESSRPTMLEFYADWCVSCKEMERFTFTDSRVQSRLANVNLLRADVTQNNKTDRELMKSFNVYGPPAIIFFAADGTRIDSVRVNGYQSAERFLKALSAAGINEFKEEEIAL